MVRTKRLLKIIDDLAKYRIFGDLGWVDLAITIVAGAFMIWLMLDNDYILLTGSLALRCAVGAAPAAQCVQNHITPVPPPPLSVAGGPGIAQRRRLLHPPIGLRGHPARSFPFPSAEPVVRFVFSWAGTLR